MSAPLRSAREAIEAAIEYLDNVGLCWSASSIRDRFLDRCVEPAPDAELVERLRERIECLEGDLAEDGWRTTRISDADTLALLRDCRAALEGK